MLFSGIPFLYYFLPGVLLLWFLSPLKCRNWVLLGASLVFYAWGEPRYVLLMAAAILAFFGFGLAVEKSRRKKLWLTASILTGAAMLGVFKYADFAIGSFNSLTGAAVPLLKLALPIGISFYTFQCMSYVVDVYRGEVPAQRRLLKFATYVSMFPQLIAGPIVRYVDVVQDLEPKKTDTARALRGLFRFLVGLGKKVLIANTLGELTQIFRDASAPSVLFSWLYAIAFALHIYFDFSGYSDMAIGLGHILGFHFPENFNYPYISGTITEFWRRWHITLSRWFRDYVYIPLGGNRVRTAKWVRNILVVWMLTGLWHGAAWNFVAWGLLFAAFLVLEKWVPAIRKLPGVLRHGYVLLVVIISFVIFNAGSLAQAGQDLAGMFGLAGLPLVSEESIYYLKSYLPLLLIGAVGATPLARNLALGLENRPGGEVLWGVVALGLLLVCTAYLVDGSFNPFLYFRF